MTNTDHWAVIAHATREWEPPGYAHKPPMTLCFCFAPVFLSADKSAWEQRNNNSTGATVKQ